MPIGRIQLKHGLESSADFNTMLQAEAYYATDTERLMIANGDGTGLILPSKNEIDTKIGDLTSLTTTEKGSIVGAVNEIDNNLNLVEFNKVAKAWGATVTPTLLNGWTGTISAEKNDLGQVHIWGNVTSGTITTNTNVTQFPAGYAPKQFVVIKAHNLTQSKNVLLGHVNNTGLLQVVRNYNNEVEFATAMVLRFDIIYCT